MKKNKISTIIVFILCWACSDNGTNAPPPPPVEQQRDTITVSLEQTTHRSISVLLSKKLPVKSDYVLNRITGMDTLSFVIFPLSSADTLIIDDNDGAGLTIDTEYSYFAYRLDSLNIPKDSSNTLTARTLPPTSHDFIWTEYTLGSFPSAELRDVWGTDENNVYAVGSVRFGDSTFGVIHWDGNEWKPELYIGGKQAIFGFSESDIWIAGNSGVSRYFNGHWIGVSSTYDTLNNETKVKDKILHDNRPYTAIWGISSENLYFTSQKGKIIHWKGRNATLMQIQNDLSLTDIYGLSDDFILTAGAKLTDPGIAFQFNGYQWDKLIGINFLNTRLYSVFAFSKRDFFVAGERTFNYFGNTLQEIVLNMGDIQKIRGNPKNGEIIAIAHGFQVMHFNGFDWYNFGPQLNRVNSFTWSVLLFDNTIFLVGNDGQTKAHIFIGRR